jgi:hypothetical protein
MLFGPVAGLTLLGFGATTGLDYVAAASIGAGWVMVAAGICSLSCSDAPREVESTALEVISAT